MSRALFVAGAILFVLAVVSMIGVLTNSDLSVRMLPALFLPLPNALVGGGDFPKLLNQAGALVVYGMPGGILLMLSWLTRQR